MGRLVVVGAGGFGRELAGWICASPRFMRQAGMREAVFISDAPPALPLRGGAWMPENDFIWDSGDRFLCAIGNPAVRKRVVERLESQGRQAAAFIDDRVVLGPDVVLGPGSIVCPGVVMTANVTLGRHVQVHVNSTVSHDDVLADFATVSPGCHLAGNVTLQEGAFMGVGAMAIPSATLGAWCIVGAGATVVHDIPEDAIAVGTPATART